MPITALTIRELGPQGDGIHRGPQGRVYVERSLPGDRLNARVRRDEAGIMRGEIIEIIEESPYRQTAPCPHYEHCGNCTLQHLRHDFYQDWKNNLVADAFFRQGLQPRQWKNTVFIGTGLRRRATFTASLERGRIEVGYYRRRSRQIADIDSCLVADPKLMQMRETLKTYLAGLLIAGKPLDIFLQLVGDSLEIVLTGPVGRDGKPDRKIQATLAPLLSQSPIRRIGWRNRPQDGIQILLREGPLVATFGALKVDLPPAAFLQATREGETALVNRVLAALPASGHFADLFSGCGTFSGPMLTRGSVDAYEWIPSAVQALQKAAGPQPLKAFRRDLFANPLRRDELNRYDAVVFDPPRGGCPEQAQAMASARVRTLVGVSCNPATFARDARILCEGGYRLQSLQIVDQFLWSHHVEMIGVFTK
jgi:23S rRNA (uracil1939-C5)-methyltransferase